MFVRKLRISRPSAAESEESISFAWQKILVAVSILGVVAMLLWSRFVIMEALRYKKLQGSIQNSRNDTDMEFLRTSYVGLGQRASAAIYCRSTSCEAISCSSIPRGSDPGTVASSFIENDFKVHCKDARSVKLSFDNCRFPENTLRRNWLNTSVSIRELTLNSCFLGEIEDDVFSSTIFEGTKKIDLIKNRLAALRRPMFRHLENLQYLAIQENVVKSAELDLLEDVADSLSILDLSQAIEDRTVLENITGGNALRNLQTLTLQRNSIGVIDGKLFAGLPAVRSLYLDYSKIETVKEDVLMSIGASVWQIMLNDNNIVSLPNGLLDSILSIVTTNRPFSLFINGNPWHCDCDLKWMQDLVQSYPTVITTNPTCKTPTINAGKSFSDAEFCYQANSTEPAVPVTPSESTAISTTSSTSTTIKGTVNVTCSSAYRFQLRKSANPSRKLLFADFLQLPPRFPNFSVSKTDQEIMVNLPDLEVGVTLVWFDNDNADSLRCAQNVKHSYLLWNIDPQTSYTICLLEDNGDTRYTVSPLNCLAVTTSPRYEYRVWLTNSDKTLAYTLLLLALLLLFLIGGFLSFLLIRRHASLLRGSKRVMLVKRRNVDAIVLPKGVDIDEKNPGQANVGNYIGKGQEDGYVTPLPPARMELPRRSRASRISLQSDRNSYVSGLEDTESRIGSWRMARLKSVSEKRKSIAPPLPPYRTGTVPTLSLAVDSKDDSDYQTFTV